MKISISNLTNSEQKLLCFLSNYSAKNPVAKEYALRYLNLGGRTFRKMCLSLRNRGCKICFSLNGGYYIAENEDEYIDFRNRYTSYSDKIKKSVEAMNKSTLYKNDIKRILNA